MVKSYSIMPVDVRYAHISSTSKVLWTEIYAYNFCKIYKIKNSTLGKDLGLSPTRISKLIKELIDNNLLLVMDVRERRKLIVVSSAKLTCSTNEKLKPSKGLGKERNKPVAKISEGLQAFWDMIGNAKN